MQAPFVSIVYLTKNGGELLRQSLAAVFSQKVDFNFEVLAVDSGSTDGTMELLRSYPVKVFCIPPDNFNFGGTRDIGFSNSLGTIVITLSQDAVPADDTWLSNLVEPFSKPLVDVVQAIDVFPTDRPYFYWYREGIMYSARINLKWRESHEGVGLSFTCCAIRKNVLDTVKLGSVEMSEDKVLQKKMSEKGRLVILQHNARVYHAHMYDLRDLVKRSLNEGLGWKGVNNNYSLKEMLADLFDIKVWSFLIKGIKNKDIKNLGELLYPIVRPLSVYIGNKYVSKYIN